MNVWNTRAPVASDLPIWAYIGDNSEDVVLIRTEFDLPDDCAITWCKAQIPVPLEKTLIHKFRDLMLEDGTIEWSSYDWFEAGYKTAKGEIPTTNDVSVKLTTDTSTGTYNSVSYKF